MLPSNVFDVFGYVPAISLKFSDSKLFPQPKLDVFLKFNVATTTNMLYDCNFRCVWEMQARFIVGNKKESKVQLNYLKGASLSIKIDGKFPFGRSLVVFQIMD